MNPACFGLDAALFGNVAFIWGTYSRTAFNRVYTMLLQTNLIYGTQHKGKEGAFNRKEFATKIVIIVATSPDPGFAEIISY